MAQAPPPPPDPTKRPPRWQAEVEEILEQVDRDPTSLEKARAAAIAARYRAPDRARVARHRATSRLGSGVWLAAAVVTGVMAWIAGLHWPLAGRTLAIASIVLFVAFIVDAVVRSRRSSRSPMLWRGQDLGESSDRGWRFPGRRPPDDDDPPLVGSGR